MSATQDHTRRPVHAGGPMKHNREGRSSIAATMGQTPLLDLPKGAALKRVRLLDGNRPPKRCPSQWSRGSKRACISGP